MSVNEDGVVEALFAGGGVAGLKYIKPVQHLYNFFQGVSACMLRECH